MKYILPIIIIIASLLFPVAAQADTSIELIDSSAEVFFPSSLVFDVECSSASTISLIRLNYQIKRLNYAPVINEAWPEITAGTHIYTSWTWDMRRGSLPPGAEIQYWWIIENDNGEVLQTSPQTVTFRDMRYDWRETKSDFLTLYWYDRNEKFARTLIDAAEASLERLAADTGARLEQPVDIYIYASSQDLQGSMIFPNEWTGGVAFTEFSTIAIGVAEQNLDWGKDAIAHELGHMVTHQITFSPYGSTLPTWLDEGLAMHAESDVDEHYVAALKAAAANDKLISLQSLSSPFSARSLEAYLSYAESQSVVEYLIDTYGKDKMLQLLHLYKQGETTDSALQITYGFDQQVLNDTWQNSLVSSSQKTDITENSALPLHIIIIIAVLALLILALIVISLILFTNRKKQVS